MLTDSISFHRLLFSCCRAFAVFFSQFSSSDTAKMSKLVLFLAKGRFGYVAEKSATKHMQAIKQGQNVKRETERPFHKTCVEKPDEKFNHQLMIRQNVSIVFS